VEQGGARKTPRFLLLLRRGQGLQVLSEYGGDIGKLTAVDKLDLAEAVYHDSRGAPNGAEFRGPAVGHRDAQRLEVVGRKKRLGLLSIARNIHCQKVCAGMKSLEFL
jgi:hypothetical protein